MMRYDGTLYNKAQSFKYPKAGDTNSTVDLYVYDLTSGRTERIDVGPDRGQYVLGPAWTPDGRLYFERMNRRQNHFEIVLCNPDGTQQVIYDERSPKYVDHHNKKPYFLPDGKRFIIREETSAGFMHLYLYHVDKGLLNPITSGDWEVADFIGVRGNKVYYTSTEGSPLRRNLYRINLNGKHKERLTHKRRILQDLTSSDLSYYIAEFSTKHDRPLRRSSMQTGNWSAHSRTTPNCAATWPNTGCSPSVSSSPSPPNAAIRSTPTWSNPATSTPRTAIRCC